MAPIKLLLPIGWALPYACDSPGEHPGAERWENPTFYQFQAPTITWECTYNNTGDNATRTVRAGQSAATNEMCMATGYYFPANGPHGCFMNNGACQCL